MKNVRKASKPNCRTLPPSKKVVKRLQPSKSIGNSLLRKLEPTLPLARKPAKFQSPYKSPCQLKNAAKITTNEETPHVNSTTRKSAQTKPSNTREQASIKERNCGSRVLTSLPKMSSVRIQPIDPYKFCEPILKDCAKSNLAQKDMVFKRSREEQRKVNQEVIALIKKTAETIKMIKSRHDKWKKDQQERSVESVNY